jgi:hypothetical protein
LAGRNKIDGQLPGGVSMQQTHRPGKGAAIASRQAGSFGPGEGIECMHGDLGQLAQPFTQFARALARHIDRLDGILWHLSSVYG